MHEHDWWVNIHITHQDYIFCSRRGSEPNDERSNIMKQKTGTKVHALLDKGMRCIASRMKEWSSRVCWILIAYGIYYTLNHIFYPPRYYSFHLRTNYASILTCLVV